MTLQRIGSIDAGVMRGDGECAQIQRGGVRNNVGAVTPAHQQHRARTNQRRLMKRPRFDQRYTAVCAATACHFEPFESVQLQHKHFVGGARVNYATKHHNTIVNQCRWMSITVFK